MYQTRRIKVLLKWRIPKPMPRKRPRHKSLRASSQLRGSKLGKPTREVPEEDSAEDQREEANREEASQKVRRRHRPESITLRLKNKKCPLKFLRMKKVWNLESPCLAQIQTRTKPKRREPKERASVEIRCRLLLCPEMPRAIKFRKVKIKLALLKLSVVIIKKAKSWKLFQLSFNVLIWIIRS
jgi:hypothetical protein